MNMTRTLIPALLTFLLLSCTSPLDIDTPREAEYGAITRVPAKSTTVRFVDWSSSSTPPDSITYVGVWSAPVMIDTGGAAPRIWLDGDLRPQPAGGYGLFMSALRLRLDSVGITGDPISVVNGAATIEVTMDGTVPITQTFTSDGGATRVELQLTDNRSDRRITGSIIVTAPFQGRGAQFDGSIDITY